MCFLADIRDENVSSGEAVSYGLGSTHRWEIYTSDMDNRFDNGSHASLVLVSSLKSGKPSL